MNAPEGFVPYEMETTFGTLTLPDRKCAMCIARWSFFSCTMCCFTHTLAQDAGPVVNAFNNELRQEHEQI